MTKISAFVILIGFPAERLTEMEATHEHTTPLCKQGHTLLFLCSLPLGCPVASTRLPEGRSPPSKQCAALTKVG